MNAETVKTITEIMVNLAEFCAKAGEAVIAGLIIWWGLNYVRPVVKRLGMGLKKRKIYIYSDEADKVKNLVANSGLFEKDNVESNPLGELDQENLRDYLRDKSLLIYDYSTSTVEGDARLESVLNNKSEKAGLIILAAPGSIPSKKDNPDCLMAKVSRTPNAVVVNAQGRMLNDLLILMMTTDFQKKGILATLLEE